MKQGGGLGNPGKKQIIHNRPLILITTSHGIRRSLPIQMCPWTRAPHGRPAVRYSLDPESHDTTRQAFDKDQVN